MRNCLLVAVVAVAALLCVPGTGFAKDRGDGAVASAKVLRSGGILVRGEGYGVVHGSPAVRALQIRLQRRGFRPGPIDGLYGPLTQAAVLRFQRKHDLLVDGIVGPQTRKPLVVQPAARREQPDAGRRVAANPSPPEPAPGKPAPTEPAPTEPAGEPPIALDVPPASAPQADVPVAPFSNSGISPWLAAALGALGAGLALGAFRLRAGRRRGGPKSGAHVAPRLGPSSGRRPSLGMVCAAMLAVFAIGAAVGALFATHAADDGRASADEPRAAVLPAEAVQE